MFYGCPEIPKSVICAYQQVHWVHVPLDCQLSVYLKNGGSPPLTNFLNNVCSHPLMIYFSTMLAVLLLLIIKILIICHLAFAFALVSNILVSFPLS